MNPQKESSGGPCEPHRSHGVANPHHRDAFPPEPTADDARLSRIDRQRGTGRFYRGIERPTRDALCDGDVELAEATRRRFVALSQRMKEARN